jgi:hypothetical protein
VQRPAPADVVGQDEHLRARRDVAWHLSGELEPKAEASSMSAGEPFHGPLPFHERTYKGRRDSSGAARVTVIADGVERRLRHKVYHSPTGFNWGYEGSGPADLARSLLLDFLGFDPHPAVYQTFKRLTVAKLPTDRDWTLGSHMLRVYLRDVGARLGVSCLRCLDERTIYPSQHNDREMPCPVCRAGAGADDQLLTRDLDEVRTNTEER